MPEREYDITILPDGAVELHIKGIKGKACLETVRLFEGIVGELQASRETSEFYEPDEQVHDHSRLRR